MKPFNVFPYDSNIDFTRLRLVSLGVAFLLMVVALGAIGRIQFPCHDQAAQAIDHAGKAGVRRGQQGGGRGQEEGRRQHRCQDDVVAQCGRGSLQHVGSGSAPGIMPGHRPPCSA